jgi:post-segregation antitoxin (ccd killing protein)
MVVIMGKYETVSVKVPQTMREKMKQLGIKPSELLRRAIEEEIKRKQVQKIKEEIRSIKATLDKIPMETIIQSVREDREHG